MAKKTAPAPAPAPTPAPAAAPKFSARPARKALTEHEQRQAKAKEAAILLKHVSDATRLQIILALSDSECHVGALCALLDQSQPAVSHHLALLRHGGVISPRRQGKNNYYYLTDVGQDLAELARGLAS